MKSRTITAMAAAWLILGAVSACFAGGPFRVTHCGPTHHKPVVHHAPVYHAPAVVEKFVHHPPNVTVVNNFVGVPVPVAYEKPIALQGSAFYGYSTVSQIYGDVDFALLYDQAGRLATQQQQTSAQATAGFLELINAERDRRQEAARITAAAQAIAQVLSESGRAPAAGGDDVNLQSLTTPTAVLKARCVSCHQKYGDWESLDDETRGAIYDRITHHDAQKRMPKGDGNSSGQPLSRKEKMLLTPKE